MQKRPENLTNIQFAQWKVQQTPLSDEWIMFDTEVISDLEAKAGIRRTLHLTSTEHRLNREQIFDLIKRARANGFS